MNIISKPINDTDNTNKLIESNTNNTNKVFIKNEDILKYTDYFNNNVNLSKYTINSLKPICKFYKLKCSGRKKELIDRIISFFKNTKHSIILQAWWRKNIVIISYNLRGPASKNRNICTNEVDFNTLEPLNNINLNNFYSYEEYINDIKYTWGFDYTSIIELLNKQTIPQNPFNRVSLSKDNINNIVKLLRYTNIIFPKTINTNNEFNIHKIQNIPDEYRNIGLAYNYFRPVCFSKTTLKNNDNREKYIILCKKRISNINERISAIFYTFDQYGNYTSSAWFYNLPFEKLVTFYKQLFTIWNNSRNAIIPSPVKRKICKLFNPFQAMFRGTIVYDRSHHDRSIFIMRIAAVTIIENLIYASDDEEYSKIGALHCLTALTVVSSGARTTLPWLWESI
jgi:hypothetical protein